MTVHEGKYVTGSLQYCAVNKSPCGKASMTVHEGKQVTGRGGQTFPKSTEIRNSVAVRAVFSVFSVRVFPWWQNRFLSSFSNVPADWGANSG